jgi:redox-sensing transcriptional repressor
MAQTDVPDVVIGRLPIYLRTLKQLQASGQEFTSSRQLGQKLGIGSAQIRKDLAHFGEFGRQGMGYEIAYLQQQIAQILHVDHDWSVALIGIGDLGQAISHYSGFARKGYHIDIIFDNDPQKIGQNYNGKIVQDFKSIHKILPTQNIKIAIMAVPSASAQEVAEKLITAGIRAILNYAPVSLSLPAYVKVQSMDPLSHLQQMSYYLDPSP